MSLITGTLFVRDLENSYRDKKLYLVLGQLWVPADTVLISEHAYKVVGSEFTTDEKFRVVGLQALMNDAKNLSKDTKKKHPSQIVSLLHTEHP